MNLFSFLITSLKFDFFQGMEGSQGIQGPAV